MCVPRASPACTDAGSIHVASVALCVLSTWPSAHAHPSPMGARGSSVVASATSARHRDKSGVAAARASIADCGGDVDGLCAGVCAGVYAGECAGM
eukprot:2865484-Pleurochrysis_carterae.AAC.1